MMPSIITIEKNAVDFHTIPLNPIKSTNEEFNGFPGFLVMIINSKA